DCDTENPLAALQQIDDLLGRGAFVHARTIGEQGDLGKIGDPAGSEVFDGHADVLQRYPGVQQSFDDLQYQDVGERVEPLAAGALGAADGGAHQAGARPVVELAVGDPGGLTGGGAAVSGAPIRK